MQQLQFYWSSMISSTCFGQTFTHLQERKTEGSCLTAVKQLPSHRTHSATLPRSEPLPTTTTGHYTTCWKKKKPVLCSWRWAKVGPKHVELILDIVASSWFSILLYLHYVILLFYTNSRIHLQWILKAIVICWCYMHVWIFLQSHSVTVWQFSKQATEYWVPFCGLKITVCIF